MCYENINCIVAYFLMSRYEFWIRTLAVIGMQFVCGRSQKCLLINGVTWLLWAQPVNGPDWNITSQNTPCSILVCNVFVLLTLLCFCLWDMGAVSNNGVLFLKRKKKQTDLIKIDWKMMMVCKLFYFLTMVYSNFMLKVRIA